MLIAITRTSGPNLASCELEHLSRQPIDAVAAAEQHRSYERCLTELGARVISLPPDPQLPDSVFVEDPAVVLDEVAVMTRMGSPIRRQEGETVAKALRPFRPLRRLEEPALLEGGDVMRIGQRLFVGLSKRTNRAGIEQLSAIAEPFGYSIQAVPVQGCLHLKTGCCQIGERSLLVNRAWVDPAPLGDFELLEVPPDEPFGANVLRIGNTLVVPASLPRTHYLLESRGYQVRRVDISELMKAEAGLTCMSLLFESEVAAGV